MVPSFRMADAPAEAKAWDWAVRAVVVEELGDQD
jgi:hypothetical protein